jgi:membrane-bound lytic murein transglycosylase D
MYQPPPAREMRMGVRKLSYTVKHGDTLTTIAQRYKVSTDDLRKWNQIGRLVVGQRVVIQVPQASPVKGTKSAKKKRLRKRAK